MVKSALEVNLAESYREVFIEPKYFILQEVMSKYYGIMDNVNTFLKELSHPYKNWQFIIREARKYSLDYFHLLKKHPKGPEAAKLFSDIFANAIVLARDAEDRADATDNFLLFLQKIIKETGADIQQFMPVLNDAFDRIRNYENEYFFFFIKSYYRIKRLAQDFRDVILAEKQTTPDFSPDFTSINLLLIKYFNHTYDYWLREEDSRTWFEKEAGEIISSPENLHDIFKDVSHEQMRQHKHRLEQINQEYPLDSDGLLRNIDEMPGYKQIVEIYRDIPQRLLDTEGEDGMRNQRKLLFLFHIMNISGLSGIHEETLREINRVLGWLMGHEHYRNIRKLIQKTFSILKSRTTRFPLTALNCVLNMGKGVYKTDDIDLVNFFTGSAVNLGFQAPMIGGVGNDWQVRANAAHVQNIRTWLEIIELSPWRSTRLLSALIIHLSICGVFIKDTDLFPRDITRLLNSDIQPVFNLVKQLARLFPVYFNDIGAEGKLRDISTQLDEISHRRDKLIHFLRKQSHVESNNRIIGFMEAVLKFWETGEKELLEPFVPPQIYREIASEGPFVKDVRQVMSYLRNRGFRLPHDLLKLPEKEIWERIESVPGISEDERRRVSLAISLYKLLYHKYKLEFIETEHYLAQLKSEAFPDLNRLREAMAEPNLKRKINKLTDYLELLKDLILSKRTYDAREDIYKKRHFTVDIPSMYGSYHELKFDALGLMLRIESLVNVLFEELIDSIDLSLITKATFYEIYSRLRLFDKALKIDGISSLEMERQLDFLAHSLEVRGFSFTQYIDIFKGFTQAVSNIINDYFNNIHQGTLARILSQIPLDQIHLKYLPRESVDTQEKVRHRISEIFSRERIATSLGLQQLDLFLSRIVGILFQQLDKLHKNQLQQLMLYDPQNAIVCIDKSESRLSGIIYLGNKGFNLVKLKSFGIPVPPGFIITTEVFRFRDMIEYYSPAEKNFKEQVASHLRELEQISGKTFGDPKNPLLLSVRSGSSISQPGMMDTFLDVGMTEEIAAGLAARTGNAWFAWDNYRRFIQCYGMSFGLERDAFDAIIKDSKKRLGILYKREFPGEEMKNVALAYKEMIQDSGIEILENPLEQLHMTIRRVMNSWESPKAKTFRKIMSISDDWGTAVTVQAMVYGNLSRVSGTGVFFTHNPRWSGSILRLWGDFTIGNQGEDVVSGLVHTLPISVTQQDIEMRDTDITLETHFPEIYSALKKIAIEVVDSRGWGPQEMEFTFESPSVKDLYLLQTRDMVIRERKKVSTFNLESVLYVNPLGHGIGVSGGAMTGRAVFDLKEIYKWRRLEPKTDLILIRSDTVPDDIREIHAADGLLTSRGGLTSHAAVVTHRLDKTCVVGCNNMVCNQDEKRAVFNNRVEINSGDYISIDGREGSVYEGELKIKVE